ncbi:recombinase family protein [Rhodococcoides fascians]|uniref:recombinase family protein n=1 Tax=Rhodococcoides fascians TaxID=1828 RepID=UPI00050C2047|nr:recombinase family protein [Rhodococcus fascians]
MRAIIYCRVSSDQTGKAKSVADQERECRAVCEREGWPVAEVLTDNDRGASRWSTKDRPAYKRLNEVLRSGDVLVLWEASRASRDLAAYVLLRDLCASRGVKWCVSGKLLDPNSGDDRFGSGLDALLAEREAEQIRERVLRGKRSAALEGRPNGRLPYGYRRQFHPDTGKTERWVLNPVTSPIVSEIVTRFTNGESLHAVARDLTERDVPPPNGGVPWRAQRIRTMISSPTYAGLRVQHGQVIGKGNWNALFSEDVHHRILGILADPSRVTSRGNTVKHLLTGIAVCGVCRAPVRFFGPKSLKSPTYQCSEGSCVRRRVELVDDLVTEAVIGRLESLDVLVDLDDRPSVDLTAIEDARTRRSQLAGKVARGEIDLDLAQGIKAELDRMIVEHEQTLRATTYSPLVVSLAGPDARKRWIDDLEVHDRRQIIRELVTVTIKPSSVGTRRFSGDDIDVH